MRDRLALGKLFNLARVDLVGNFGDRRLLHETRGLVERIEQRFDFAAQVFVTVAGGDEIAQTLVRRAIQRVVEDSLDFLPTFGGHWSGFIRGFIWLVLDEAKRGPCSIRGRRSRARFSGSLPSLPDSSR